MSVIDPGLKFLQVEAQQVAGELGALSEESAFSFERVSPAPRVKVLLQFEGNLDAAEGVGFEPRTVAGDVATGTLPLGNLEAAAALDEVLRIEVTRPMQSDLIESIKEIGADTVHTGPPGHRGSGVLIGIIDSGIDIMHEGFRRPDGSTRILAVWDQHLTPTGSETSPGGFSYGVEYTDQAINASLGGGGAPDSVRHADGATDSGHGTHVAGIAAGDGSVASNGQPAFSFIGVAPEADLIIVRNDAFNGAIGMGDSANTLDAVNYIFTKAKALNRPVVINQSQGDNIGPHDGTSLLERGIDNLLGAPGQIMVKSAGNEGDSRRHASGTVPAGETESVQFNMPADNRFHDTIDVWYKGSDEFSLTLSSPDGNTSVPVAPGSTVSFSLDNGNSVFVDSTLSDPNNADNRIFIRIDRGSTNRIQPGNWSLNLQGDTVEDGRFDAWIDRNIRPVPTFISHVDPKMTISVPGTSQKIISVGSYITGGAGVGSLSSFSSRGPTRDGRPCPTLSAPGQWIMSARAKGISRGAGKYLQLAGTSMAAPHVAGAVALILQQKPDMTQDDVRDCLTKSTRDDGFTGKVPNDDWGAGKLDVKAACERAAEA